MANQGKVSVTDIIGKTIAGVVCHQYFLLNDILIVQDVHGNARAIQHATLSGTEQVYTINGETIEQIQITNNGKMFLFQTKSKQYLVNDQNQIVEDSDKWNDAYFDVLSNSFYRQDQQGFWYDIEGFKMKEKVFIKNDVLISLASKKSKKSLSFTNQELFITENKQLIQVGKIVMDLNLEVVKYFGERITGLGRAHITFEGKDVLQEVMLGLEETAFINEFTHEPYLFGDSRIVKHLGSYQYGQKRVEVFQEEKNSYAVEGNSSNFLLYNGAPLQIEFDNHINFNDSELIQVSDGKKSFYFDLNKNQPFSLPALVDKNISEIDQDYVRIGQSKIFNVSSPLEQFAVHEKDGNIFKLDNDTIQPQKIEDGKVLQQYYGFAIIDGQRKLFSKKYSTILKFGKDELEVSQISYTTSAKLINAIDTNGNKLVLDLRHGFDNIKLAETSGEKITSIFGQTIQIGTKTLQNVHVATLGGNMRRVVDINDENLLCFTLPTDLKQISDRKTPSVFAGNFVCEIKMDEIFEIEGRYFLNADFTSFSGKEFPIILQKETGTPLHLDGAGHKNELAISWVGATIQNKYFLGEYRMVGVKTIREDLKENELLFSIRDLISWLPFHDKFLPIFKQIIDVKDKVNDNWDYHLFECREVFKDKEYIAVEKKPPYRILADKKEDIYEPRIVTSKRKSIKSPEELTTLQRLFYSGYLVEVE